MFLKKESKSIIKSIRRNYDYYMFISAFLYRGMAVAIFDLVWITHLTQMSFLVANQESIVVEIVLRIDWIPGLRPGMTEVCVA